jgi:DNA polymerase-3 subunit alpha
MEGYLSPGSRHERKRATLGGQQVSDDNPGEMYTHMTLLAENTEGMHNLFRLSSLASLEGYYYKPRMDRELLETYGKGIIATTGCPVGRGAAAAPAGTATTTPCRPRATTATSSAGTTSSAS